MAARIRWHQKRFEAKLKREVSKRMALAVELVKGTARTLISRGQPLGVVKSGKTAGRRFGLDPSKPGEPPKKVEGRLFNSIAARVVDSGTTITGQVGTNVIYARRLELGTKGNQQRTKRPFLRPALKQNIPVIRKIFGARRR